MERDRAIASAGGAVTAFTEPVPAGGFVRCGGCGATPLSVAYAEPLVSRLGLSPAVMQEELAWIPAPTACSGQLRCHVCDGGADRNSELRGLRIEPVPTNREIAQMQWWSARSPFSPLWGRMVDGLPSTR